MDTQYDRFGNVLELNALSERIVELEQQIQEVERCKRQLRIEFESLRTLLIGSDMIPQTTEES